MDAHHALSAHCEARVGSSILDRYRLIRLVGVGGMGGVYEAEAQNGARFAVKVLHRSVSQVPGMRERFHREALIAKRIDHPGVVRIFDDGVSDDGDLFLVMELLHGETLEARAERAGGALPLQEVFAFAAAALDVLEAAHNANVIHRDLKPENLFLTNQRTLRVLDFGIARLDTPDIFVKRTKTGVLLGTPAFMAPEQARGTKGIVDRRTDVWAMGAIMYTLLSGLPVHEGDDVAQVLTAASMRPATSLARVVHAPLPVVRIVDRALSFDASERYASARDMHTALLEAVREMQGQTQSAAPPPSQVGQEREGLATVVESDGDAESPFRIAQPSEEDRAALVSFFTLLERALLAVAQYGVRHPETERRFATAVAHAVAAIRATGKPLEFNVTPYSFSAGTQPLWEPQPPFDRVPYQLFADGIRLMTLAPGLEDAELDTFLRLITTDKGRTLSPEDDFVTMLWECDLEHVQHHAIDSFGEGDLSRRNRFELDVQSIQTEGVGDQRGLMARSFSSRGPKGASANRHTAHVAALLTRGHGADMASVVSAEQMLAVDPVAHAKALDISPDLVRVLAARMNAESEGTEQKFLRAVGLAWNEAKTSGAAEPLARQLRLAVDDVVATRPDAGVRMAATFCRIVSSPVAPAGGVVLSPASLEAILAFAQREPASTNPEDLRAILASLDASFFDLVLAALLRAPDAPQSEPLVAFFMRPELAAEPRLGDLLAAATEEHGLAIIRLLIRMNTPPSRAAIAKAAMSRHPVVRVEALGHLEGASSDRLRLELKAFLEDADPGVRIAALRTIEHHRVRVAGPSLVLRIKSGKFDALPFEERRQALATLATLAVRRAEEVCIEVLNQSSLIPSESRDQSRALAAELLGQIAQSPAAQEALEAAASSRWRGNESLRAAASMAKARLSQRPPAPPPSNPGSLAPPPIHAPSYAPPPHPSVPPPSRGKP